MGLREIKAQARADLHREMRVRALYVPPGVDPVPVPCHVRVHTKFVLLGNQKGTNLNSAENEDTAPRLVFWVPEVREPKRGGYVTISAAHSGTGRPEAYRLGVTLPDDGLTVTVRVAEVPENQLTGLLFRED